MTSKMKPRALRYACLARCEPRSTVLAVVVGLTVLATPLVAQDAARSEQIVRTQHQITLNGQPLRYAARAGLLPIRDNESGDVRAHIYFVAYTLDRAPGQPPRPIAFLWNGGPGMNSSLIHLLGFGPKRIKTGDTYPTSAPISETALEDNQETWLDQMDLVFVDPVGTGYSRPTRAEYGEDFFQTQGDAEAITELIRVYRARFDAWDQPLFIVGHSYGTTRAMTMSAMLERRGIRLSGVVLMSGGIAVGQDPMTPVLTTALAVPGMTGAAFYHQKLAPELQRDLDATLKESEAWALNEYAPALSRRGALSDIERDAVLQALSRYTGLAISVLDHNTLGVERDQFKTRLLAGQVLGNYDYRMKRSSDSTAVDSDLFPNLFGDPSFGPAVKLVQGTSILLNRYMRQELQFKTDLLYQGPLGGGYPSTATSINRRFNRNRGLQSQAGAATQSTPPLRQATDANPAIRVFLLRGLYDSLGNGCARHVYTVKHLEPDIRRRVMVGCYGAGHDFYTDKFVRQQIKRDMMAYVRRTLAGEDVGPSPQ